MASEESVFKVPEFKAPVAPPVPPAPTPPVATQTLEDPTPHKSEPKESSKSPAELLKSRSTVLNYKEPEDWTTGEDPPSNYFVEEIKNGTIVKKHGLAGKTFFVIGRLPENDIHLEHPSLSRHHAIIQYKSKASQTEPVGFYLYDLGSTHGSYHNKKRCFPNRFYRLRVGHCLKFGGSTRLLILQGPEDDMEAESNLSVTELKAIVAEKARKKADEQVKKEEEESNGISWGMGDEDAHESDEEEEKPADLTRNPFSVIREGEGKELNLTDTKKTLRNWYEKEGFDQPNFECSETGFAQFKCILELPVDDEATGRPLVVEVEVKGKKKEAVAQCAMEACRMLDKAGMLRNQSSRENVTKLKAKKLEEDDFYASDEDEFLDRTGTLETKRKQRMKMLNLKVDVEKSENHETLCKKSKDLEDQINGLNDRLKKAVEAAKIHTDSEDLDSYMASIKDNADAGSKDVLSKLKLQLATLQKEKIQVDKLVVLTKPNIMPQLKPKSNVIKMMATAKPVAKMTAVTKPTEPSKQKLKAFEEDEEDELKAKPKLKSLEQFKKDIEEEKNKPAVQAKKSVAEPKPVLKRATLPIAEKSTSKRQKKQVNYSDLSKEDDKYQTWVPPSGQTGDGRTSLNDKLGY